MERFSFDADVAVTPRDELLERVTIAPLSAPSSDRTPFQAAVIRFAPGGRIACQLSAYASLVLGIWGALGVLSLYGPGPASRSASSLSCVDLPL